MLCTDTGLRPFTEYHYSVSVVNGAGTARSDYSIVTTAPSLPEGLDSLQATVEPSQLDTIYLEWQPPEHPNGGLSALFYNYCLAKEHGL